MWQDDLIGIAQYINMCPQTVTPPPPLGGLASHQLDVAHLNKHTRQIRYHKAARALKVDAMCVLVVGGSYANEVRVLKLCKQASAESQLGSRQMVGEETPAAYVHPAQEATAIGQADGIASGQPASQGQRSSSEALQLGDEVPSPPRHLQ